MFRMKTIQIFFLSENERLLLYCLLEVFSVGRDFEKAVRNNFWSVVVGKLFLLLSIL